MFDAIPNNGQTWLICGGRDFTDTDSFDDFMGRLIRMRGCPAKIVHGAAKGADTLADKWGKRMALDVVSVPADWAKHGRSAGPRRNQQMLDERRHGEAGRRRGHYRRPNPPHTTGAPAMTTPTRSELWQHAIGFCAVFWLLFGMLVWP